MDVFFDAMLYAGDQKKEFVDRLPIHIHDPIINQSAIVFVDTQPFTTKLLMHSTLKITTWLIFGKRSTLECRVVSLF